MNQLTTYKNSYFRYWALGILSLCFTNFTFTQSFYKTYSGVDFPSNVATPSLTSTGYQLNAIGFENNDYLGSTLETDLNGNKTGENTITVPFSSNATISSGRLLSDGTLVTASNFVNNVPVKKSTFAQYDQDGNFIQEFELVYPNEAGIFSRPYIYELPNGNIYLVGAYSLEDPQSSIPRLRHFVFAEYDLTNQQFIFTNDILWSSSTIEATVNGIKMGGDGKLILYIYESQFANRHLISKHELDGTEVWKTVVSTLERPITDFQITPEGGAWYWNSYFNSVGYLNPDGSSGGNFNLSAFQNGISGPANVQGIISKSDNNALVFGSANPSNSPSMFFTAEIATDGNTVQSHLIDLPEPRPSIYKGIELASGEYLLGGIINTSSLNSTPFLLKLDENGNIDNIPTFIDLEVSIDGSNATPDIWNFHTITVDIDNTGDLEATGIEVEIPKANGSVYQGGAPYSASQGTFDSFNNQIWNVGTLPPGGTASITINYFRTSSSPLFQYAQVTAADQSDFDSQPNNGDGSTPAEDDEGVYGNSGVDFYLSYLQAPIDAVAAGNILEFTYYYGAIYPFSDYTTNTNTTFYLSLDGVVSNDDILITSDTTTFSQSQNTNRTLTVQIPGNITPGVYNLIGKIDPDNVFSEPNEDNNTISFSSNYEQLIITPPTGNLPDLSGSSPFGFNPIDGYDPGEGITSVGFDLYNTGEATNGSIQIKWYLSIDQSLDANDIFLNERNFDPTNILHFSPQFISAPSLTVPSGITGGDYWVLVYVDANDNIAESTENNNVSVSLNQVTINGNNNPCSPDLINPMISGCPTDITLTTTGTSAIATWVNPTATDNCGTPNLTSNFNSGQSFPVGTSLVTYTATDGAGNFSECSFSVTVSSIAVGGCTNNLLANSGFENGLNGWNNRGGGLISSNAYSGSSALQVCADGESRVIQSVQVQGGKTYTLEFYGSNELPPLNSTGGATVKFLTSSWQPLPAGSVLSIPSEWSLLSHDFTAPANAAFAEINFQAASNACIFIDEVCFSESSSPSADCQITIDITNIVCSDNGTPDDSSDDTYTFDRVINSSGNCGAGWIIPISGYTGDYGVKETVGPLSIAAGGVVVTVSDQSTIGSIGTTFVNPPPPCSNGSGQQADLVLSTLNAPSVAQVGDIIQYNFDLQNLGTADAVGDFSIKAYFSSDNLLSSDDIFDGIVPTGNLGAGITVTDVPGASTIPNLTPGDYYLILKADADEQILESNENNNTISSTIVITIGGGGTPNCSADSDFPWHDWISNVTIGSGLDQSSGKSTYSDFTSIPITLVKGATNNVSLTTSYSYFTYDEYWRIWIDLNQNDIFEANEIVLETTTIAPLLGSAAVIIFDQLTIPTTALEGLAKMRVIMRRDNYADPCGSIDFGEVEDYLVNIISNGAVHRETRDIATQINAYPNPANNDLSIELGNKADRTEQLLLIDQLGEIVFTQNLETSSAVKTVFIDLTDLSNGVYFLQARGKKMKPITKKIIIQKDY